MQLLSPSLGVSSSLPMILGATLYYLAATGFLFHALTWKALL